MRTSPSLVTCALLLCATVTAGCTHSAPKDTEGDGPVPVAAEAAQKGDIHGVVSATGTVVTLPSATFVAVAPETARILEVSKNVGDHVASGEVLVRLEFPSLKAEGAARAVALKGADLHLQSARLMQARVHSLFERGAASQKEADDADQEVTDAETEVTLARAGQAATDALAQKTTIRAPFDGSVSERLHNPGDVVGSAATDGILRVVDQRQIEVTATVALADAKRFTIGASARAVAEGQAAPNALRVMSRPDPEPGATTIPVQLTFEQPTELVAGTQVGIEIDAEQHSNVTLVRSIAVVKEAGGSAFVFVVSGNQARKRPVVTGLADGERVEIASGLKAGELVITQGQSGLRDGIAITVGQ
jgi:RND family efflux transporter MFP subunit